MNKTWIDFYGYKNLMHQNGASFCSHDGHYSINIKTNVYPLYLDENSSELGFDHCQQTFFEMVDMITSIYGYKGYTVTGRSGGYIEPLIEGYQSFKPIDALLDEYISFEDYIVQQKIDSYAESVLSVKSNLEGVYKHSSSLSELVELIEKLHEGVVYV